MAQLKRSGVLTGTAGVYFVASWLAAKGFHAAPTFGNAPSVDVLVGSEDGSATLCLQVKTSRSALRWRGRKGKDRHPDHYEWSVGERSGQLSRPNLLFTFVDLKGVSDKLPDVFIISSEVVYSQFDKPYFKSGVKKRWWRFDPKVEWIQQYKNNWHIISDKLESLKRGNQ